LEKTTERRKINEHPQSPEAQARPLTTTWSIRATQNEDVPPLIIRSVAAHFLFL
jgi:hypothetical protein